MIDNLTSIIINTRNGHKTIKRAIKSALNQSFKNTEIIVYDNASEPSIKSWVKVNDSKLKFIRCEDALNLGEARNNAFNASSGNYVVFLDDDDIMLPNKIELCINALIMDSNIGMIYSNVYVHYQNINRSYLEHSQKMPEGDMFDLLIKGNFILWQSTFFKREALMYDIKPFPSKFNNITDYSLYLKIAKNWKIKYIDEPLSIYILHGNNYSINNNQAFEELIMLANEDEFSNEEKVHLKNYANNKKISKSLEMNDRKKLLSQIVLLKSTKTKFRLCMAFFLSYIIDIKTLRLLLIKMKKNKYSKISNIIDTYEE
jgi:glycosyltransferase involved in cell wall biosynthesis